MSRFVCKICQVLGSSLFIVLLISIYGENKVLAQPTPTQLEQINRELAAKRAVREALLKSRDDQLSTAAGQDYEIRQAMLSRQQLLKINAKRFYRRPTKDEADAIALEPSEVSNVENLLIGKAGAFRLLPFVMCPSELEESKSHCAKYSMPGNGSSYSFRESTYRLARLGDLAIDEFGRLKAGGQLAIAFLVDLGRKADQTIHISSPGLRFLSEYKAPERPEGVKREWEKFELGLSEAGYIYARTLPLIVGHTYGLRTIAYKGTSQQTAFGHVYNELDYDNRVDQVVLFTIDAAKDRNGFAVKWRLLRSQNSPKYSK